jgi:small ligand-binding sensory domain FIST
MPFHAESPALPQLSAEQWSRLLTNISHRRPRPRSRWSSTHIHVDSSSDSDADSQLSSIRDSTAMLMLSAPHFTEVERLLQRFSNVLPGMPVLGGVTEPNAWGETEHSYGALFLGSRTFAQGAVGCVMHGPLAVQHLMVSGCRAVGRGVMTVTANGPSDPSHILSLDGRPAQEPVSHCGLLIGYCTCSNAVLAIYW